MADMSLNKHPMPEQEPLVRNKNFEEVALGYAKETAIAEAQRCLNCKNPSCVSGCPVNVRIPEFIAKVAEGDMDGAYEVITSTNALPAICGRVCPQEKQCEGKCIRAVKGESVGIGRLERFVADWHNAQENAAESVTVEAPKGKKVAVVGSGPAGLTCAGDLARRGYDVTVFEAFHKLGGVLIYGIPEFRLPKDVVAKEIKKLESFGVKFVTNAVIGKALSVDDLFEEEGFEAVFIGSGAGLPQFLHIPGENLLGVFSANEYLTRINLMKASRPEYDTPIKLPGRVAVIGAGNVAMDAARCAKRMGAEVSIVYRRGMEELPARKEEVKHAQEEEIQFKLLNNPVAILGDENGCVKGLECVQMELGEPDASGRRRPIEKPGSNFVMDVDAVILAIGTNPNPLLREATPWLETNPKGCIVADENMATSRPGVYAGGDAVSGAATVILAMGAGKTAAKSIAEYLEKK